MEHYFKIVNSGYNRRFSLPRKLAKTRNPKRTLVLFEANNKLYLKFPVYGEYRKMYFGLPCEVKGNKVKIKIHDIFSEKELLERNKEVIKTINGNKHVNLRAALAKEIKLKTARREKGSLKLYIVEHFGELYIFPRVFVMNKQPFIIKKYIPLEDFAAIFGFYFAEGEKKRRFSITNSEKETLEKFLDIVTKYVNLSEFSPFTMINYVPKDKIKSQEELKSYWEKLVKRHGLQINLVRFIKKQGKKSYKRAEFGSLNILLSITSPFYFILGILHSPTMQKLLKEKELAWEILRWTAAGDTYPKIPRGKLQGMAIATENLQEVKFYRMLLSNCGIKVKDTKVSKNNEFFIYGLNNFVLFALNDLFKYIKYRKRKFHHSLANLEGIKILKSKENKTSFTYEEICRDVKFKAGLVSQLLNNYYLKANLVSRTNNSYSLTKVGKRLLKMVIK